MIDKKKPLTPKNMIDYSVLHNEKFKIM